MDTVENLINAIFHLPATDPVIRVRQLQTVDELNMFIRTRKSVEDKLESKGFCTLTAKERRILIAIDFARNKIRLVKK